MIVFQRFLGRKSFAGQYRFVNKQFARFKQLAIARNNCAGRKQRDVARHNFHERDENFRAIAQHAYFRFHHRAQLRYRVRRAVFLPETEQSAE